MIVSLPVLLPAYSARKNALEVRERQVYGVSCPMKARIFVTLKGGVLDPQGKAIHHALEGLGFGGVNDVRAGKLIELDLADGTSDEDIDAMCRKLLANTVIENYRIEKVA
jgi:phosphoribosylformylglycinamidine synthase